jgi:5-formyltetrahydrofolate cyclo-ligase
LRTNFATAKDKNEIRKMTRLNIKDVSKNNDAKRAAKMQDLFLASEQDRTIFFNVIIKNEMPNTALMEAAKRYVAELCKNKGVCKAL